MKRLLGLIVMTFVFAGTAAAQDFPQGRFRLPTFEELDKNKDGKITRDEWVGPPQFFDRVDLNGDGAITKAEWDEVQQRFGLGQGQGQRAGQGLGRLLERLLDANRDGKVSKEEFAKIADLFDKLDANHDGFLTAGELAALAQLAPPPQQRASMAAPGGIDVDQILRQYDTNHDGKLSAEELKAQPRLMALDIDRDGFVTREELEKFIKSRQQAAQKNPPAGEPKKP